MQNCADGNPSIIEASGSQAITFGGDVSKEEDNNLKSKFWGRSIQLDPVGVLTLEFDDGKIFQWSKLTRQQYEIMRREAASLRIQKYLCMHLPRKTYNTLCSSAVCIQTGMRVMVARNDLRFRLQTRAAILIQSVLDGKYDDLSEQSFYMVEGIEEVIAKAEKIAKEATA
ncbi:hypothetical protein Syun_009489 [Stephania yunnanensis]|uniref:H(+)-transporting two-sector ATPase n=1 Tax=Stephania yunnanensis TaxID=152371 RepID=A0AAP0PQX0_9MAGN